MSTADLRHQRTGVLPGWTRGLAVAAGLLSGFAGSLLFGTAFWYAPLVLILGTALQHNLPRIGLWVLVLGALILSFYVAIFLAPQAYGAARLLPAMHGPMLVGMFLLLTLAVVLVAWLDVALVMSAKPPRTNAPQ